MNQLISYSIGNTNMVSGVLTPGGLNFIICPEDGAGNSPKALLIQCTDWLKISIYVPDSWGDSHAELASTVHANGILSVMCPKNASALWVQNVYSSNTVNYYITPLDGF